MQYCLEELVINYVLSYILLVMEIVKLLIVVALEPTSFAFLGQCSAIEIRRFTTILASFCALLFSRPSIRTKTPDIGLCT